MARSVALCAGLHMTAEHLGLLSSVLESCHTKNVRIKRTIEASTLKFDPSKNCFKRCEVSLDKVESSNPNLTAAHAGASTGETGHLQPNASKLQIGGLFCIFAVSTPSRGESPICLKNNQWVFALKDQWQNGMHLKQRQQTVPQAKRTRCSNGSRRRSICPWTKQRLGSVPCGWRDVNRIRLRRIRLRIRRAHAQPNARCGCSASQLVALVRRHLLDGSKEGVPTARHSAMAV